MYWLLSVEAHLADKIARGYDDGFGKNCEVRRRHIGIGESDSLYFYAKRDGKRAPGIRVEAIASGYMTELPTEQLEQCLELRHPRYAIGLSAADFRAYAGTRESMHVVLLQNARALRKPVPLCCMKRAGIAPPQQARRLTFSECRALGLF